ncbi:hypothetical protein ABIA30_005429 [Mycobacterium sp. MAA66]|uniref:hypothetical protein n=1 Tax=Mycobacterium sp. MAA66 TaxID=3156297 RepID=UPI003512BE65
MRARATISGRFLYIAWNVHLRLIGPFVLPSEVRRRQLTTVRGSLAQLESIPGIGGVRLLESTFVVPLPGGPRFDVVLLINGSEEAIEAAWHVIEHSGVGEPAFVAAACNVERFGDTDAFDGPILLNHFISPRSAEEVTRVWSGISDWYGEVLGVDNSTLLAFDDSSRFVVVNYASIPGPVVRFMSDQLLRPSFRTNVLGPLKAVDARALPVFARRVHRPVT